MEVGARHRGVPTPLPLSEAVWINPPEPPIIASPPPLPWKTRSSARALGHKELGKAMTTYRAIQDDIKRRHGRTLKRCWIVHAKELNALSPRVAPNQLSPA